MNKKLKEHLQAIQDYCKDIHCTDCDMILECEDQPTLWELDLTDEQRKNKMQQLEDLKIETEGIIKEDE